MIQLILMRLVEKRINHLCSLLTSRTIARGIATPFNLKRKKFDDVFNGDVQSGYKPQKYNRRPLLYMIIR